MQKSFLPGEIYSAPTHPGADAIIKILDEQCVGWNTGNSEMYSKSFAENGCFTNIFGMFLTGHPAFLQNMT